MKKEKIKMNPYKLRNLYIKMGRLQLISFGRMYVEFKGLNWLLEKIKTLALGKINSGSNILTKLCELLSSIKLAV